MMLAICRSFRLHRPKFSRHGKLQNPHMVLRAHAMTCEAVVGRLFDGDCARFRFLNNFYGLGPLGTWAKIAEHIDC